MARRKKENAAAPLKWEDVPEIPKDEQPYPLPEGWKWARLGEVAEIIMGQSPAGRETTDDDAYTPLIGGASDMGALYPCSKKYTKKPTKLSKVDDIILCIRATLGKPIYSDGIYCLGRGVAAIRSCLLERNFLRCFFINFESYFYEHAVGSTFLQISSDKLKKMPVPYPRPEIQERIVTRIESLFSKLDEAAEKIQSVIDSHEARKQASLHQAFSGKLTCCEPRGFFPISHFVQKEKNSIKAGPFGSALKKDVYVSHGYKVYGQEQVISGDEDFGNYFISEEKYQDLKPCAVRPGDILISLVGTVGRVLVLSENCKPGIINPRLIKIALDSRKMLPQFFSYYFQSDELKSSYQKDAHGTTMDVLNMRILKQLKFPAFTLKEQQKIVRVLDRIFAKQEQIKEHSENVLSQLGKLKKTILTKAFSGELV